MAQGTPKGRAAAIATGSAIGATVVAGMASVVVQLGGVGAYTLFALMVLVALALLVSAGYWIQRARTGPESG